MIDYIDAFNLIKQAADLDILHYCEDKNYVIAYHDAGKHHPAGWFATELDFVAQNLTTNKKAYALLKSKVDKKLNEIKN